MHPVWILLISNLGNLWGGQYGLTDFVGTPHNFCSTAAAGGNFSSTLVYLDLRVVLMRLISTPLFSQVFAVARAV
jgi:hypothetical protein